MQLGSKMDTLGPCKADRSMVCPRGLFPAICSPPLTPRPNQLCTKALPCFGQLWNTFSKLRNRH